MNALAPSCDLIIPAVIYISKVKYLCLYSIVLIIVTGYMKLCCKPADTVQIPLG